MNFYPGYTSYAVTPDRPRVLARGIISAVASENPTARGLGPVWTCEHDHSNYESAHRCALETFYAAIEEGWLEMPTQKDGLPA